MANSETGPVATVVGMIERTRAARPDAPAIVIDGVATSYAALDDRSRRAAAGLAARGVGPGDRVAVWLPNRVEWLAVFLALCRLGAILVAVNTRYRSSEVEHLLSRSGAKLLVMPLGFRHIDFPARLVGISPAAVPTLEGVITVGEGEPMPESLLGRPPIPWPAIAASAGPFTESSGPDAPCILFSTSGTTRGPKLVLHVQRSIAGHAADIARSFGFDQPSSKLLCFLPFCGVFGLVGTLAALAAGIPILALETFDGGEAARLASTAGITHCFGSDEMFARMLEQIPDAVGGAGSPFPAARCYGIALFQDNGLTFGKEACRRGLPLLGIYGSSEAQALFAMQDAALPAEERTIGGGQPIAGLRAQARVRNLETGAIAAPGTSGELEIRTPHQFVGYFGDPEATAQAMTADGFFRTGDLARMRDDGSFVFEARLGDALRLAGFLVNPSEVEAVLRTAPGIAEARVTGIRVKGDLRPVAFVVMAEGKAFSAETVIAHCRARMAKYKVPFRVWQVDAFPVAESSNGTKIQRARLRQAAEERLAQEPAG